MKEEVRDIISTMNVYEKQELIKALTEEIHENYNQMINSLINIEGHVFGMIINYKQNSLNELTMTQLGRIEKLSKQVEKYQQIKG